MKNRFNKRSLIRWKVYIDRSKMYVGYIQFVLIIFVFIKSLEGNWLTEFIFSNALIALPILFLLFIFLSLLVGYLDSRLGIREEEIRNFSKSNPVLTDIQDSISALSSQLKELEQKLVQSNNLD